MTETETPRIGLEYRRARQAAAPAMARSSADNSSAVPFQSPMTMGTDSNRAPSAARAGDGRQRLVQAPWTSPAPTISATAKDIRSISTQLKEPMACNPLVALAVSCTVQFETLGSSSREVLNLVLIRTRERIQISDQ
jgi:hypothetical protein